MSIISGQRCPFSDEEKKKADIIYVSMVLGFCATRMLLGEPVQFDLEQATKAGKLESLEELRKSGHEYGQICNLLDTALASYSPLKKYLTSVKGSSVPVKNTGGPGEKLAGGIIVGKPGGSSMGFRNRVMELRSFSAMGARSQYWKRAATQSGTGYQGVGTYVGIVDDPINHVQYAKVTQRYLVNRRWTPSKSFYEPSKPPLGKGWAQLGTGVPNNENINLSEDVTRGMGDVSAVEERQLGEGASFGYTHGMILAIGECVKAGPWCIPFEMAAGKKTKKLASCFMCTVYMYSAGFPPSSIHLDRAESWWPLVEHGDPTDVRVAKSLNDKWKMDCRGMLQLGVEILMGTYRNITGLGLSENKARAAYFKKLDDWLRQIRNQIKQGDIDVAANMLLDSAMHHANDKKKIAQILGPMWPQPAFNPDAPMRVNKSVVGLSKEWP
jgi:hypothetical protein